MLYTLEHLIEAISISRKLVQIRLKSTEDMSEKEKLSAYERHEQKKHDIWQYTYFLIKGAYFNKKVNHPIRQVEEVDSLLLLYEMKKALLYYELAKSLSGAQKCAAEQALCQALEHSSFFSKMMHTVHV